MVEVRVMVRLKVRSRVNPNLNHNLNPNPNQSKLKKQFLANCSPARGELGQRSPMFVKCSSNVRRSS